ncbi:NADP-dependent oxidoreductase domain-containing protein [Pelagophyceae sp. CCMP2097]|nr:NADP-dependent oxidoreductase domain-containing protein [Pelagophyceae sp. CCMP2097]
MLVLLAAATIGSLGSCSALTDVSRRKLVTGGAASVLANVALVEPRGAYAAAAAVAKKIPLGKLGIGAWAWGDTFFWGYDEKLDAELAETFAFLAKNKAKLGFIDTAEVYGFGRSETLIGEFAAKTPGFDIPIATKFAALPWRTKASDVVEACEASLKRLGRNKIELYQIHFPNGWSNEAYWDGLAQCVEKGLVESVGVSNYGVEATRAVHAALAKRGIPLASNQIQFSALYRFPEENGLLQTCKELDVDVLAYSPLCLGLLTGKFTRENGALPTGPRKGITETYLADDRFTALQQTMASVGAAHGAPPAAVALNWCRAKGTIPIAGARTLKQAKQNLACLDWDLTGAEVGAIDASARQLPLGISPPFANKDVFTGMKMFDS